MAEYENAIEIANLTKKYDGFTLDNVSINVPKGSVMGFVGQNGAGKTTTIRSLLGIIRSEGGTIKLLGEDLFENESELKDRIAVVFDEIPFHEALTAADLSKILGEIYSKWDNDTFFSYLDRFHLPRKKKIGEYSKGMKMKLQISAALSHNAELLVMDEATTGLDPVVRSEMLDVFMEYIQDENHTIFMSSHITSDLERIADSITFIHDGKIIMTDCKDVILENHRLVKCTDEQLGLIADEHIVSIRKSDFGNDVMIKDFESCGYLYKDLICDKTNLDEILLFYVRGKSSRQWSI